MVQNNNHFKFKITVCVKVKNKNTFYKMFIHTLSAFCQCIHYASHLYICSSRPIPQAILTVSTVRKGRARLLQCLTNVLLAVSNVTWTPRNGERQIARAFNAWREEERERALTAQPL